MKKDLPSHAQVVIIGGGIHGCSVAYHLAKQGLSDVVLLERKQLTSGTTWHAAGLVGQLQGSHATTAFAKYGIELLQEIEAETGQNPGYRRSGSISIAVNDERMAELKRKADFAALFGVEAQYLETDEIRERWPLMNPEGVLGGIYMPSDGSANPVDLTTALAKGARMRGAKIFENIKVEEVLTRGNKAVGVRTDQGSISADYVVNCGGMWARELGRQNGVGVPLHACEHYYLVTEAIENLPSDLPVLRSYCDGTYWKEDAGKLLFGFAHFQAKPWGMKGISEDFEFDSLPFVEDDVMEVLELAMNRVPLLQETGIRTFFNGPESYSYDGRFILGQAPDIANYFVLGGVNSTGIQSGSGAGRALAQWIIDGHPPIDLSEMDPKRCEEFQARDAYLQARCPETLVLTYAMHWPNRQRETARNLRRTPFYHPMKARGACFTETQGWERPGWFAPEGVEPKYEYSFGRQNWFPHVQEEQKAAREAVAMIDYSMLGKLMVEGRDAESFLQRACTNNMAMANGRVAYTLMLNERGGIESDVTVARHGHESFMVMSSISHTRRDYLHLRDLICEDEDVRLRDATSAYGVLGVMGPQSRALLEAVSDADLSNAAFPFNSLRHFHIGHAQVFAQRLSYSGELGWEIFVTPDFAEHVFEVLMQAGEGFGIRLIGGEALNALRLEKGFLHWGHDMAYTEAPHQIGLEFVCKTEKPVTFIGREAYLARKAENKGPFLCSIKLRDPGPLLHHNEPVLRDGKVAGYVTAGAWGQTVGASVGLCFLTLPEGETDRAAAAAGDFTVLVEGKRIAADVSLTPFYDPDSKRMLAGA
ncbi:MULTISPECIES: GcvT family protein [unclassified Leisingera]|uniref:GcvT family protein n=1 Tax=unclassified Leisingera TaxID=2614906 RepID=UPI00030AF75F|nr:MULTISPECIES: FAD-dependent oxidoreductase [unclassified Leisingera]KIC22693.1 FAD-dependent oxidoreductase [Leisingera sp. ANG-S3]KIC29720.1 FAD-dependent oxidoreductase [Leisingera sp. ANG-S5]KIC51663.1 FAD-dependent oxidoreductase [Leisingera sp. ANG-S]KID08849.1 FAD-dependent oxidoreductase [Leisingera sp. ANG1]